MRTTSSFEKSPGSRRRTAKTSTRHEKCHDDCDKGTSAALNHPDHSAVITRLNRIQGQIQGIERMIFDQRYCPDILTQFRAVSAALRRVEATILEAHLKSCVRSALLSRNAKDAETKVNEVIEMVLKR